MSRLNREAAYIYDVDGETVWERLRVIRNFLQERRMALQIAELFDEKLEAMDKTSFEYKEALIQKPQHDQLTQQCRDEIAFLENFEHHLAVEAERTRVPGKTDEEMYELNFFTEVKSRLLRDVQVDLLTTGGISRDTMKMLLRNRDAMSECISLGLLPDHITAQLSLSHSISPAIPASTFFLESK